MAAVTHAAFSTAPGPVLRLLARLAHVFEALAARRERARQMRELYAFTDRDLWDVGLSRSDFMAIEKGVYRRD